MYSNEEKHQEAIRELKMRERVYDNLVNVGKMTRAQADKQIAIMREIAADYEQLAKGERLL